MPVRRVTNEELTARYGLEVSERWIRDRSGIECRRFADEGVGTSEMGTLAARAAIADAGIEARQLDLIVFATLSPDHAFPGAGVYLQNRLGLCDGPDARFVPALDVRNQCSGFVYGLSVAVAHVRAGMADHVLVVGAETHSAAMDLSSRGKAVASLFGDGAGAVVVSRADGDRGIRGCYLGADGRHADLLSQKVWDIRQRPFIPVDEQGRGRVEPDSLWPSMAGRRVFKHAVERMTQAVLDTCERHELTTDDVDVFLFHQANLRINEYVARKLGIDAVKVPANIQRYGNTTAATIPLLMHECVRDGRIRAGMRVLITVFGSGFTWGTVLIDW